MMLLSTSVCAVVSTTNKHSGTIEAPSEAREPSSTGVPRGDLGRGPNIGVREHSPREKILNFSSVHFEAFLPQQLRQIICTFSTLFTIMKTTMTNFGGYKKMFRPRLTKCCWGCVPGGVDAPEFVDY